MSDKGKTSPYAAKLPYLRGTEYKISCVSLEACPDTSRIPQIAFVGRSNSGKSSLLSALCDHHNLARSSRVPGKTRTMNYFFTPPMSLSGPPALSLPNGLYLVDLPGYGYAKLGKNERRELRAMVDGFLVDAPHLALLILVLDARREPGQEEQNILRHCARTGQPLIFARTKWDTLNNREREQTRRLWRENGLGEICLPVSNVKKIGLAEILQRIGECARS